MKLGTGVETRSIAGVLLFAGGWIVLGIGTQSLFFVGSEIWALGCKATPPSETLMRLGDRIKMGR